MNKLEQEIYNTYLATSRSQNNKPFKIRKDFQDFDKNENYIYIKRLYNFFTKFKQINKRLYFKAPYVIYPDTKYFDLSFYSSPKAIKTYTLYMQRLKNESPDSDEQIEFIKNSLKFIALFCLKQKIPISQYLTHKTGINYSWIKHLIEHKITFYSLFEFPNLYDIISSVPRDQLDFFLGDIVDRFGEIKTKYNESIKAKQILTIGLDRVTKYIENNKEE